MTGLTAHSSWATDKHICNWPVFVDVEFLVIRRRGPMQVFLSTLNTDMPIILIMGYFFPSYVN